ncbi:MAG TPA: hypothetical protein VGE52_14695 [Pirellulales bacterium]
MSAKQKLNSAHVLGSMLFAGLAGAATQSMFVFVAVWGVLVGLGVHSGDIRLKPGGPRR